VAEGDVLILTASDVQKVLLEAEGNVLDAVRSAYLAHEAGRSLVPPSCFLKLHADRADRIIALPAHLVLEATSITGLKWVASFPGNLIRGADRASAVILLNHPQSGKVEVIMEASQISLWRTAASAALAASTVHSPSRAHRVGFIGCGKLSLEVLRFLRFVFPQIRELWLADAVPRHQEQFAGRATSELLGQAAVRFCQPWEVLTECPLITLATTAAKPYLIESVMQRGSTLLHLSLRDLTPEVILSGDNVVDDLEHAVREDTSIDLTQRRIGHLRFVRCSLGKILSGVEPPRAHADTPLIFSPFGLGVLDLAVAQLVLRRAQDLALGHQLSGFHPIPWNRSDNID
jgi:ornithine cyclodeaminase